MYAYYPQFRFAFAMPKEQQQRSSVSTVTVNDDSGAAINLSINELIQSFVAESIGALVDNLSQIIDDRLFGFFYSGMAVGLLLASFIVMDLHGLSRS